MPKGRYLLHVNTTESTLLLPLNPLLLHPEDAQTFEITLKSPKSKPNSYVRLFAQLDLFHSVLLFLALVYYSTLPFSHIFHSLDSADRPEPFMWRSMGNAKGQAFVHVNATESTLLLPLDPLLCGILLTAMTAPHRPSHAPPTVMNNQQE